MFLTSIESAFKVPTLAASSFKCTSIAKTKPPHKEAGVGRYSEAALGHSSLQRGQDLTLLLQKSPPKQLDCSNVSGRTSETTTRATTAARPWWRHCQL